MNARRLPHSNIIPIWTPQDAIDTARQFHLELDNAERGVKTKQWWLSTGRERTARIYDAAAVALLLILAAVFGCIIVLLSAPNAKADDGLDPEAVAWAAHYASAVCSTIADYPSTAGLLGIMESAEEDGLTAHQAGEAVGLSIYEACPRYGYIVNLFIAQNRGQVA